MHALTVIGCRNNVLRTSVHIVSMSFLPAHIEQREYNNKNENLFKCQIRVFPQKQMHNIVQYN